MSVESKIKDTIRDIARQGRGADTCFHTAVVRSVAENGETCSVEAYGTTWTDVRLTAVADGGCDVKVFPKVGSPVLVADLSNGSMSDLAVIMYSRFDRIELGTAEHTAANADVLRRELDKLTRRVDTIIRAIENAVPTPQDGGAGLKSTMVAVLQTITGKEDFSGIEDSKIKHG
ncbi:MAG: hypothetical protein VZQ98_12325 [Bacteroidales bacterium]|nr:hypothetical protein [Bacteroidales bacterium]